MILSSEELGILEYLRSWSGKFIPMIEISRRAVGRRKYEDDPHWAKGLVSRLVDAALVEVNERGHYRILPESEDYFSANEALPAGTPMPAEPASAPNDNYFPTTTKTELDTELRRWLSPEIAAILKRSGKKADDPSPAA